MIRRHPLLAVFTVGYLAIVAWVTLGPQPITASGSHLLFRALRFFGNHELTHWITYSRIEFTANIAMFVPIGLLFALVLGRRRWWLASLIGVAMTIAIELSQLGIPGRVSDPRDVLANSVGSVLGVLLALAVTAPAARRDREAFRQSDATADRTHPTRPIPLSR
jgi:glycopeptide antibiotics resistance protein